MGEFSLTHLLLLAIIFLIFFGPSRLPQLGQSLGKAIRGFKQGLNEIEVDAKDIHDNAKNTQNVNNQQQGPYGQNQTTNQSPQGHIQQQQMSSQSQGQGQQGYGQNQQQGQDQFASAYSEDKNRKS